MNKLNAIRFKSLKLRPSADMKTTLYCSQSLTGTLSSKKKKKVLRELSKTFMLGLCLPKVGMYLRHL